MLKIAMVRFWVSWSDSPTKGAQIEEGVSFRRG
jgi:hypothetical protein